MNRYLEKSLKLVKVCPNTKSLVRCDCKRENCKLLRWEMVDDKGSIKKPGVGAQSEGA